MKPTSSNHNEQLAGQVEIESLPDQVRQWCLTGKSVSETAHLAKNIIQMVSGSAEIIALGMEKKQFDRVQKSWALFEPNLKRLQKFVLDLIKYTRHYPIEKTECDFNSLVRHSLRRCERILKHHSVKLELAEDKTLLPVSVDADRIQDLVVNLLTHALDNLPDHAGTIRIQTRHLPDHRQVQLSVSDDGPAMTDAAIRSLGEPCERVQNMCGTGFDIPLAKLYIEQHHGYMEFESTPDKGNTVRVYLPIQ